MGRQVVFEPTHTRSLHTCHLVSAHECVRVCSFTGKFFRNNDSFYYLQWPAPLPLASLFLSLCQEMVAGSSNIEDWGIN